MSKDKSLMKLAQDLGVPFSVAKIIHDHAQPTITVREIKEGASETWDNIRDDPSYKAEENIEDVIREILTELGVEIVETASNDEDLK